MLDVVYVFFLFHLRPEFYVLSAGVFPVCEWNIKHQPHIFSSYQRKSSGNMQRPARSLLVYQGICSAVSYSSLAMADIACIFWYQVNINCKGTNKPVPYTCLILFHLIPVSLTDLVYCYVSPENMQRLFAFCSVINQGANGGGVPYQPITFADTDKRPFSANHYYCTCQGFCWEQIIITQSHSSVMELLQSEAVHMSWFLDIPQAHSQAAIFSNK